MKWITGISVLVAVLAVAALLAVLKIGIYFPPRMEDMTFENGALHSPGANVNVYLFNQTRREIGVQGILDGSVTLGTALIRDQHFGGSSLSMNIKPGEHTLEVRVCGRPSVAQAFTFSTTAGTTNCILISIFQNEQGKFEFKFKQNNKGFAII